MYSFTVSKKGGIKMYEFKVGDEVYFTTPYSLDCYESMHGVITEFAQSLDSKNVFAVIRCGNEKFVREYHVFPKNLYRTKEEVEEILKREFRARVDEVKKDIHTLEDLLKFLYNNDVSVDEDDDDSVWEERVAVRELAKEICGIELGK